MLLHPTHPTLTLVEKLYAVTNINNVVPVKLNIDELNYSSWCYFLKIHCENFGVLNHIEGESDDDANSSDPPPPTDEWKTADSIVKSWIFLTLAPTLQESIVTLLNDLGSSMTDDDVVTYAINGLSKKYAQLATIIAHKDHFPDLDTMRSIVITEEMRLNSRSQPVSINASSSAPQVLRTETPHANRNQDSHTS
ncbi:hypothetical protein Tco_1152227 [Tanacetum coccineum]